MWERTLQDLIRGLRANKQDEAKFIARAVDEIRQEVRSKDMELKAAAILKLTFLDMLGNDMSWASFNVVEVMSSPKFHIKCIGYLAAVQSFNEDTDVLMLTTNLMKKDLTSSPADVAVTLNGVSQIITSDLARDLTPELIAMLNHSRPHIRKRAVLVMYKVFTQYPEAIRQGMARFQQKLEDTDPGVVAATVNVLCELAIRNPKNYLTLAPQLFHILTTSSNNWVLIKVVKLFGYMTPCEPRLVKKLQPPITDLISTTSAISLLYECVHTCIIGGMLQGAMGYSLARTCVSKLAAFIQDPDQNLKYISLLAMVKIIPTHPHLIAEYQDTILASVDDEDITIRMRALDLVSTMINRENLQSIVQQILSHLVRPQVSTSPSAVQSLAQHTVPSLPTKSVTAPSQSSAYRLVLSQRILSICSANTYDNVADFEWYLSVLVDLAYVANVNVGAQIRDQLVDIVGRVRDARPYAVKLMVKVLSDDTLVTNAGDETSCAEVLWAAAWICGEYCDELAEPQKLLPYLLQPNMTTLDPDIVAVYIQTATKIFGSWAAETAQQWTDDRLLEVRSVVDMVIERMSHFVSSEFIEVQERAANTLQLFSFIQRDLVAFRPKVENGFNFSASDIAASGFENTTEPLFPKSLYIIQPLFSLYPLNPVASVAQASVPVPDGLDLNAWIVPAMQEQANDDIPLDDTDAVPERKAKKSRKGKEKEVVNGAKSKNSKKKQKGNGTGDTLASPVNVETAEQKAEREKRQAERMERLRDDPYYLIDDRPQKPAIDDVDSIPVVRLDDILPPPKEESLLPSLRRVPSRSKTPVQFVVERVGEMPEGAIATPLKSSTLLPQLLTPTPASPQPSASSSPYEIADDDYYPTSPQPIKVTRVKKKGAGIGKKKRTKSDLLPVASP